MNPEIQICLAFVLSTLGIAVALFLAMSLMVWLVTRGEDENES